MNEVVEFVEGFRKAVRRMFRSFAEAYNRIPESTREGMLLRARERRSIDNHEAAVEAERQAGLAYVRELGAQARRDLGLPEEER